MWLSLLTVIPSGNQELPAQVETWEGLEDSAGLPGPLPAAPRVPRPGGRELTHSPGNPSTWATERSICGMCWACNETFWRLCGKARCALRPGAGLTSAVVEPGRLHFLRRVWPPSYIWLQLAQRPFQMPMSTPGSLHLPQELAMQICFCAFLQSRSPGVVDFS